jgi:arsenate reductase
MAKKVMVLCTGNSCRSQMAEGFLRELGRGGIEAHSAGVIAAGLNRWAVAVMRETGIDISGQRSKTMDPELLNAMDYVITVCGNAEATCPATPPNVRRIHVPIDDPVGTRGTEEEIMQAFRRARDEIRDALVPIVEAILKDP